MMPGIPDKARASSTAAFSIRKAAKADIEKIVDVHLASFEGFFLSFLGPRFLRLMYTEILTEPGSVSLIALSQKNEIIGFVVGVMNQSGLYKRLAKNRWFSFAVASGSRALLHPSIIPRLLRALTQSARAEAAICPALLMSVAVSPEVKGGGVGKALVRAFLTEMANQDIDQVCLTTDRDGNEATNAFYRKLNFSLTRQFQTPEGRWMNEYLFTINENR